MRFFNFIFLGFLFLIPNLTRADTIAYATSTQFLGNGVTSIDYPIGLSGTNECLIVGFQISTGAVSGTPTYNGIGMTQVGTSYSVGGATFQTAYLYRYCTATGDGSLHNVHIDVTTSAYLYSVASAYTGVNQTTPVETSANATPSTGGSISQSVTTSTAGDWLVSYLPVGTYGSGNISASTNTTARQNQLQWIAIGDSNGPQSPAGSYSQAWSNSGGSTLMGLMVVALKPAVAAAPPSLLGLVRSFWW